MMQIKVKVQKLCLFFKTRAKRVKEIREEEKLKIKFPNKHGKPLIIKDKSPFN